MRSIRSELLALAALSCACDPQVDGGYLGEPLAIFDGYVSSASVAPLEAAMLWQRGPPPSTDDQELATRARVVAGFPARFTLRLYRPPPAAAQRTLAPGEVPYARANAAAVPYGIADGGIASGPSGGPAAAPPADAGTPDAGTPDAGTPDAGPPSTGPTSALYGMDPRHWIVYLPQDVPPGLTGPVRVYLHVACGATTSDRSWHVETRIDQVAHGGFPGPIFKKVIRVTHVLGSHTCAANF